MGCFFVGKKVGVVGVEVAVEFLRPVALFAGVLGGAEVLERGGVRPLVVVQRVGDELVGAVELGFDEPLHAGADVALDTVDPRMGPAPVVFGTVPEQESS